MYDQNIMSGSQTKAGRPRNQSLDAAILSAAARQFGELGYARMSLESVAAAAGTTVPSLRRRYHDKAELVAAVMERNDLTPDDVISVLFTVTPDLTAEFPALAAVWHEPAAPASLVKLGLQASASVMR